MTKPKQRYIKNENRKWLISYFLLHIIMFSLFAGLINFNLTEVDELLSKIQDPKGFIPLICGILIIMLEGLFKNPVKEFIVFWRFKNRLPGHRAFTNIGPSDSRIDMDRVKTLFPEGLPEGPKKQNTEWYQLYHKYQNVLQVFQSHKAFLLTRDFASLTIIFIPLSIAGHFILGNSQRMFTYHILVMLILFVSMSLAARHYGERFVANVLLEASIDQS